MVLKLAIMSGQNPEPQDSWDSSVYCTSLYSRVAVPKNRVRFVNQEKTASSSLARNLHLKKCLFVAKVAKI
jgi:hypothetical protein